MQAGFIISLFFAILVAVFALRNGNNVNIDFLFAKIQVSQAIVIFVSAALGAIIVTILGVVRHVKLSMKIKEQSKLIGSLESEKQLLDKKIEEMRLKEIKNYTNSLNDDSNKKIVEDKGNNSISDDKNIDQE